MLYGDSARAGAHVRFRAAPSRCLRKQDAPPGPLSPRTEVTASDAYVTPEEALRRARWVIDPNTQWKSVWDMLVVGLILYSVVVMPYRVAFAAVAVGPYFVWESTVDALFAVDMLFNFFTAFPKTHTGRYEVSHKRVAWHYVRTWFLVDALSTFPFAVVAKSDIPSVSLLRVLRLARLFKLLRILRLQQLAHRLENVQDAFGVYLPATLSRLVSLMFRIMYVLHLVACVWFAVVSAEPPPSFADLHLLSVDDVSPTLRSGTSYRAYITTLYFIAVSAFSVGYGDYVPRTLLERVLIVFVLLLGSASVGLIIGSMSDLASEATTRQSARLEHVRKYLRDRDVPMALQRAVVAHFKHFLDRVTQFDEQMVLDELSPNLRIALVLQVHQDLLRRVPFLGGLDFNFLAGLLPLLKPTFFREGCTVFTQDDYGDDMYFVVQGAVELTLERLNQVDLTVLDTLRGRAAGRDRVLGDVGRRLVPHWSPLDSGGVSVRDYLHLDAVSVGVHAAGSYFGECSVLLDVVRASTATTREYSEMLWVSKDALSTLLLSFPVQAEKLIAQAKERLRREYIARYSMCVAELGAGDPRKGSGHRLLHTVPEVGSSGGRDEQKPSSRRSSGDPASSAGEDSPLSAVSSPVAGAKRRVVPLGSLRVDVATALHASDSTSGPRQEAPQSMRGLTRPRTWLHNLRQRDKQTSIDGIDLEAVMSGRVSRTASFITGVHGDLADPDDDWEAFVDETVSHNLQDDVGSFRHYTTEPWCVYNGALTDLASMSHSNLRNMCSGIRLVPQCVQTHSLDPTASTAPDTVAADTDSRVSRPSVVLSRLLSLAGVSSAQRQAAASAPDAAAPTLASRLVLHPSSTLRTLWDIFIALITLYSVLEVPFRIGFSQEATGFAYNFDVAVDFVFLSDVVLNMFTGFIDEQGVYVSDLATIRKRYLRSWFTVDMVSSVPLEFIVGVVSNTTRNSSGLRSFKLLRILRLMRLLKLFRILRLSRYMSKLTEHLNVSPVYAMGAKLLFQVGFVGHFLSCLWVFITIVNESEPLSQITALNWWTAAGAEGTSVSNLYILALYFTYQTIATVGYGDVVPVTTGEKVTSVMVMLIGASVFGHIVNMVSHVSALAASEGLDSRKTEKLREIKDYLRERRAPPVLRKRVAEYYERSSVQLSLEDTGGILADVPSHLRATLVLYLNRDFMNLFPVFQRGSHGFLVRLLLKLRQLHACTDEFLSHAGTPGKSLHFLVKGRVRLVLGRLGECPPVTCTVGDVFGETEVLTDEPSLFSAVTTSHAHLFLLDKGDVEWALMYMHDFFASLKATAVARLEFVGCAEGVVRRLSRLMDEKAFARAQQRAEEQEAILAQPGGDGWIGPQMSPAPNRKPVTHVRPFEGPQHSTAPSPRVHRLPPLHTHAPMHPLHTHAPMHPLHTHAPLVPGSVPIAVGTPIRPRLSAAWYTGSE